MKDLFGTKIKKGDIVAVGQRSGNSGAINLAKVLDIRTAQEWRRDVEQIKILGVGEQFDGKEYVPCLLSRAGWTYPNRVVVVNKSVPKHIKKVFKDA